MGNTAKVTLSAQVIGIRQFGGLLPSTYFACSYIAIEGASSRDTLIHRVSFALLLSSAFYAYGSSQCMKIAGFLVRLGLLNAKNEK